MDPRSEHLISPYRGYMNQVVFHWLDDASSEGPTSRNGSQAIGRYGIAIAWAVHADALGCPAQGPPMRLRQTPEELLSDLRSIAGAGIGPERAGTLDARSALVADLDPSRNRACAKAIRLDDGIPDDVLLLTLPSRLIVAEVDHATILVQIWARTPDELAAWLPDATRFVDGIRFLPVPGASLPAAP